MAKLIVGAANDPYEQEADHVASQVAQQLNEPPSTMQRQPYQRGELSPVAQQLNEPPSTMQHQPYQRGDELSPFQTQPLVQRNGTEAGGMASPALEESIQRERAKGQQLADSVRQPMETAMGADFSGVRIHTDSTANDLSESIQAKAFTTGQDVFFRQGAYAPQSKGGQELLAHELTHVVQQNGDTIQRTPIECVIQRDGEEGGKDDDDSDIAGVEEGLESVDKEDDELDIEGVLEELEEAKIKCSLGYLSAEKIKEVKQLLDFVAKVLEVREVDLPEPDTPDSSDGATKAPGETPTYTYLELVILYIDRLIEGAQKKRSGSDEPGSEDEGMKKAKGLRKALSAARYLSESLQPLADLKSTAEASPVGLESIEDDKIKLNVLGAKVTFSPGDQQTTVDFPSLQLPKKAFESGVGLNIPIVPGLYVSSEIFLKGALLLTPSQKADIKDNQLETNVSGEGSNLGVGLSLSLAAGLPGIADLRAGLKGELEAQLGTVPLGVMKVVFNEAGMVVTETLQFNLDAAIKGITSLFAEASFLRGMIKKEYTKEMGTWDFGTLSYASPEYLLGNVDLPTRPETLIPRDSMDSTKALEKQVTKENTELESQYKEIVKLYESYSSKQIDTNPLESGDIDPFVYQFLTRQITEDSVQDAFVRIYPSINTSQADIEDEFQRERKRSKSPGYNECMIQDVLGKAKIMIQGKKAYLADKITAKDAEKKSPLHDIRNAVYLLDMLETIEMEVTKIENAYQAYQGKSGASVSKGM
jgi:hypothetical protein